MLCCCLPPLFSPLSFSHSHSFTLSLTLSLALLCLSVCHVPFTQALLLVASNLASGQSTELYHSQPCISHRYNTVYSWPCLYSMKICALFNICVREGHSIIMTLMSLPNKKTANIGKLGCGKICVCVLVCVLL